MKDLKDGEREGNEEQHVALATATQAGKSSEAGDSEAGKLAVLCQLVTVLVVEFWAAGLAALYWTLVPNITHTSS